MARHQGHEEFVVVGIDCATEPRLVGLATGVLTDGQLIVEEVATGTTRDAVVRRVAGWLGTRTLLALDAPLGWPRALGDVLHVHRAGAVPREPADAMFRRKTDDVVRERVGKRPLDVGADRIARTAHAALSFLKRLRERTGLDIPLAWKPGTIEGVQAIEVYPAGTLASRELPNSGYKGNQRDAPSVRRTLVIALEAEVRLNPQTKKAMADSDHVLDAVVCALAAAHFARGEVIAPTDRALAEREGWIWAKPPEVDR